MSKAAESSGSTAHRWLFHVPLWPSSGQPQSENAHAHRIVDLEPDASAILGPVLVEDRLVGRNGNVWPSGIMVGLLAQVLSERSEDRFRNQSVVFLAREFFPIPVHRSRFDRVMRAAASRARAHGTDAEAELIVATATALCLVEVATTLGEPFERQVRRQVNELVTRDFLGDDWRGENASRRRALDSWYAELKMLDADQGAEDKPARVFGEELIQRARLTKAERAVLSAHLRDVSHAEIARARGVSASTVRNQFMKAKEKLRAVLDGTA